MTARVAKKLEWQKKYYDFEPLIEKYADWAKLGSPNSYTFNQVRIRQYVLPFFLGEKDCNNVNQWPMYHQEFKDWLRSQKNKKKEFVAIATVNNCITAYNSFIEYLKEYNQIDAESAIKIKVFPEHMTNERGFDDVILEDERDAVFKELKNINQDVAEFFWILWHTGMRFHELFTLPVNALFKGEVEASLHKELSKHDYRYTGYILLESQGADKDRKRLIDKSLERKPLKGHRKISAKDSRVIPIWDSECWNFLARRYKKAKASHEKNDFGMDLSNYLFFEGMNRSQATSAIATAYKNLKLEPKSFHCCRHSFATLMVGKTQSIFLTRAITGHKSDAFERYLHVFEQMNTEAKRGNQEIEEIS